MRPLPVADARPLDTTPSANVCFECTVGHTHRIDTQCGPLVIRDARRRQGPVVLNTHKYHMGPRSGWTSADTIIHPFLHSWVHVIPFVFTSLHPSPHTALACTLSFIAFPVPFPSRHAPPITFYSRLFLFVPRQVSRLHGLKYKMVNEGVEKAASPVDTQGDADGGENPNVTIGSAIVPPSPAVVTRSQARAASESPSRLVG